MFEVQLSYILQKPPENEQLFLPVSLVDLTLYHNLPGLSLSQILSRYVGTYLSIITSKIFKYRSLNISRRL